MIYKDTYKQPYRNMTFCTEIVLCILFLLFSITTAEAVIYVKPGGNDSNSGLSWTEAKKTVTAAINIANTNDEIWVAAGTYAENVQIMKKVGLYGGFQGNETIRNQRDWISNVTTLNGSSSGSVVTITGGVGLNMTVDGFTITGGISDYGGGISVTGSSPTITNNLIKLNGATAYGGGIFCSDSSPSIISNSILRNFSGDDGGGISCWRNSSPFIANNYIIGNISNNTEGDASRSVGGGGIFSTAADLDGTPHQTATAFPTIINNIVAANGGDNGAGIRISDLNGGTATITNNTVMANSGTGIYWQREFSNTSVVISNNIVSFNTFGLQQRGTTFFQIRFNNIYGNSLFEEDTDYIALSDQTGVNGNISADPHLANYKFGNFHLQPDSPCKNTGSSGDVGSGWTDIDGQNRIIGSTVDMGADESDGSIWSTSFPVIYVRTNGDDSLDGLTWAAAKKTLQGAILAAPSAGWEIWVAEGTYSEHIIMAPFVYLYGGFNGTEVNRDSRNFSTNRSIIDGGGIKTIVASTNTGYLVSALDGFTIQNGGVYTAGGVTDPYGVGGFGGGIYINVSSPLIANNLIRWNSLAFDNTPVFPQPPSYGSGIYSRLSYAIVSGNTIRENEILNYYDGKGAGIYCSFSGLMIRNNTILQNHSRYGSAIYCTTSAPYILGNLVENNAMYNTYPLPLYSGSATGAINLDDGTDFIIQDNLISGNTAAAGAGAYVSNNKAGRILNNIMVSNTAADEGTPGLGGMGGGIYCYAPLDAVRSHSIVNNTIVDNTATGMFSEQGGGVAVSIPPPIFTPPVPIPDRVVIANNIIAFNSSGIFETLTSPMIPPTLITNDVFNTGANYIYVSAGASDLSENPAFEDKPLGDYHLQTASPCIEAGSNSVVPEFLTTDFEGNLRITDGDGSGSAVVDIGAFETPGIQAGILGDINKDGQVDISDVILDLRIALGLDDQQPCSDINGDGGVDISDVILTLRMALGLDDLRVCT